MARRLFLGAFPLLAALAASPARAGDESGPFGQALVAAERALGDGKTDLAKAEIDRALERDAKSPKAWDLRARWAEAVRDDDERAYALHRELALLAAQGAPRPEVDAMRKRVEAADPLAPRLLGLGAQFLERLLTIAKEYEKARRPHAAIRAYREAQSLAPDRTDVADAIARVSAAPDPTLAETARAKDPLANVSEAWILGHDRAHATWDTRAKLEKPNYVTETDAGYAVLVRAAEVMEQMNAFYRQFFRFGTAQDGKKVPRIALRIFKDRDEYLALGKHPVEWSGGQFVGDAVETYTGGGGFSGMAPTLFHEAAHQFVGLATTAAGWLNEGLACFFEGCRIQANGTVLFNEPSDGRLFDLASRMEKGWMAKASDGIDPAKPSDSHPERAPTFRIVLEDEYAWGPPWYAPTWGVVYFLWNYRDPADGRYVYRKAFQDYVDASGGKTGKAAIQTFEKVVLGNPQPPTRGVADAKTNRLRLPKAVDDVDEAWRAFVVSLRDERSGKAPAERPWLAWARHALTRKDWEVATEHFEKGLLANPRDPDLLAEFAEHLATRAKNHDRACKLAAEAVEALEAAKEPDLKRIAALEGRLEAWDPKHDTVEQAHRALWGAARGVVDGYAQAGKPLMTMLAAQAFGADLGVPGLEAAFEAAVRSSGKTLALWQLAYDEQTLLGWAADEPKSFTPYGTILRARHGVYEAGRYDVAFCVADVPTSGDYSIEAEVRAEAGKNALSGLVFGRKDAGTFHAVVLFPEGWVDLVSFLGTGTPKTWRHNPVRPAKGEGWRTLRVDVAGTTVDMWVDGEPVASQEFPSMDVLRGPFGLFTGVGDAEFRHVRYLVRPGNDLGARIERQVRLERQKAAGTPVAGSYVGLVPPFPKVEAWVQGARTSWDDRGPVPTLLAIWSRRQDDLLPIHHWLSDLALRYGDAGLEVVAVCEKDDPARVREHLAAYAFPGCVGIDSSTDGKDLFGATFDAYFVGKTFQMPRLLLLDVDHRVVWEGAPGFDVGKPWQKGEGSYLDAPLDDLVAKRHLKALRAWLREGKEKDARAAVRAGDATYAGAWLAASRDLPGDVVPEVGWAKERLARLEKALAAFDATGDAIAKEGGEPAVAPLLGWAKAMGRPVDPKANWPKRNTANGGAWTTALGLVDRAVKDLGGGGDTAAVGAALVTKLGTLPGRFPKGLAEAVQGALDAGGDAAGVKAALEGAPRMPAAWLAGWLKF